MSDADQPRPDEPVYGHPPEEVLGKPWTMRQRIVSGALAAGIVLGILVFVLWTLEQIRGLEM
jgi:hypothetical protein